MRVVLAALGALAIASTASAQAVPQVDYSGIGRMAYGAAAMRTAQAQQAQDAAEYRRQLEAENLMKAIGGFMADGRCIDARNVALRGGRLDLTSEIDRLCRPSRNELEDILTAGKPEPK